MEEVFDQYGGYIIAVISCAVVIGAVTGILGLGTSDPNLLGIHTTQVNVNLNESISGTGIFGKLICLWLNRIM